MCSAQTQRPLRRTHMDASAASKEMGLPSTVSLSRICTRVRDVAADHADLRVLHVEIVERVRGGAHDARERLLIDPADARRAGNDARVVREAHRRIHVSVLDGLPVFTLELEQFFLGRFLGRLFTHEGTSEARRRARHVPM